MVEFMSLRENVENQILREFEEVIDKKIVNNINKLVETNNLLEGDGYPAAVYIARMAFKSLGLKEPFAPQLVKTDMGNLLALPFLNMPDVIEPDDLKGMVLLTEHSNDGIEVGEYVDGYTKTIPLGVLQDSQGGSQDIFTHIQIKYTVMFFKFGLTEFIRDAQKSHVAASKKNQFYTSCVKKKGLDESKISISALADMSGNEGKNLGELSVLDPSLMIETEGLVTQYCEGIAAELISSQVSNAKEKALEKNPEIYKALVKMIKKRVS